jgi:hypothetical protein
MQSKNQKKEKSTGKTINKINSTEKRTRRKKAQHVPGSVNPSD